jgi:hypothetical protein
MDGETVSTQHILSEILANAATGAIRLTAEHWNHIQNCGPCLRIRNSNAVARIARPEPKVPMIPTATSPARNV